MRGLGRTAPSAMNSQDIELDVILFSGVYVYDAEQNLLRPILTGDVRGSMLTEAEARAHVTILYVADAKDTFAQVDTGFIGQNVYLFAASEGLNAWFYTVKADRITAALKLPNSRIPLCAQSIGYPTAPLM
jgi:nitroreductase